MGGFKLNVHVSNEELNKCLDGISAFSGRQRLIVEGCLKNGVNRIKTQAKQRAPKRTGKLRKSITSSFSTKTMSGEVRTKVPYAHFVELGAKAAVAKPKNKKKLHFGNKFADEVRIPKRDPKPYLRPAYDAVAPTIVDDIKRKLK